MPQAGFAQRRRVRPLYTRDLRGATISHPWRASGAATSPLRQARHKAGRARRRTSGISADMPSARQP
jgi:hypothetical protein